MEKNIYVYRWHDYIHGKPQIFPPEMVKANKQFQQKCRIQNQQTKMWCILYTNNVQSDREIKKKTISFTIESKK